MAGEGGIPGSYVIEARQFDIKDPIFGITIAQHNFLVLYGPDGAIIAEQHYQPMDPSIGIAMDFSFGLGPKLGYNLPGPASQS
jgi:hypothetical protein